MKKLFLTLGLLVSLGASAAQYETKTIQENSNRNSFDASYPVFSESSALAYENVNKTIEQIARSFKCSDPMEGFSDVTSNLRLRVIGLNADYIGIAADFDYNCGGAFPSNGTVFFTIASKTGAELDIDKEFGLSDSSANEFEIRNEIANILAPYAAGESDCFKGSKKKIVKTLNQMYPTVGGLAKDKQVVLTIIPGNVDKSCQFSAHVSYQKVKSLIIPGSYLHQWLK